MFFFFIMQDFFLHKNLTQRFSYYASPVYFKSSNLISSKLSITSTQLLLEMEQIVMDKNRKHC